MVLAAAILLGGTLSASVHADTALSPPTPYEASYKARSHGMSTDAYRRLVMTGDNVYQVSHGLSLSVLGANLITVGETSHFFWMDSGAIPVSYEFEQSGVRRRNEAIHFDWETDTATVTRGDRENETAITDGLLDNLSFTAQMSAQLAGSPDLHATDTVLSYNILDGTEPEIHEYRVTGQELVETGAGALDTLRIERIRDPDSERSTVIWLAMDHEFVLAKLEQIEEGSTTQLTLESISMSNNASPDAGS